MEAVRNLIKRWSKPSRERAENNTRAPSYGFAIDHNLKIEVEKRLAQGLPIDDTILRFLLIQELNKAGKTGNNLYNSSI